MAAATPALPQPQSTAKTNVDEVLLDLVVRDKKGKPITDLKPEEITITDNGAKQTILSFRLVRGSEAISATGASTPLDPLRQIRLVTLAFEPLTAPDQRKLSRAAALDLVKGDQGVNVFYSVVVIDTRLLVLQHFTKDHAALVKAIMRATEGLSAPRLTAESDAILAQLQNILSISPTNATSAEIRNVNVLSQATNVADAGDPATGPPPDPGTAGMAKVMLDMLRMGATVQSNGTRLSLSALRALVDGLREMPGRKSIMYFSAGMYRGPELDNIWRHLVATANRDNVTFYSVDTRGVMVGLQNDVAMTQLNGATAASANTTQRQDGGADPAEIFASDNAEIAGRANLDLALRDLAESLCFPGLWKFLAAYPSMCGYEVRRSFSRSEFCRSLQRLVPDIRQDDLETGGAGVRAQAMTADGRLVEDFHFEEGRGILHVVNAPSPAATAALAIGAKISEKILTQLT